MPHRKIVGEPSFVEFTRGDAESKESILVPIYLDGLVSNPDGYAKVVNTIAFGMYVEESGALHFRPDPAATVRARGLIIERSPYVMAKHDSNSHHLLERHADSIAYWSYPVTDRVPVSPDEYIIGRQAATRYAHRAGLLDPHLELDDLVRHFGLKPLTPSRDQPHFAGVEAYLLGDFVSIPSLRQRK